MSQDLISFYKLFSKLSEKMVYTLYLWYTADEDW